MTDQCQNCTSIGDYGLCLSTPCNKHDDWIVKELQAALKESNRQRDDLLAKVERLRSEKDGYKYLLTKLKLHYKSPSWVAEYIEDGLRLYSQKNKLPEDTTHEMCEHGKGLTDYCEPCGRTHGGG